MKLAMKIICSIGFVVALYLGLGIGLSKVHAQDKTFPVGVPVFTQALFCRTLESAKLIADNKGNLEVPQVQVFLRSGECRMLSGNAIYVKEVYRNGEWGVFQLESGNIPVFYEATDYKAIKPKPKGQTDT